MVLRGGQHIPSQLDLSAELKWKETFWATTLLRTSGIFGVGLGGEVYQGIILSYSYNLSNNINAKCSGIALWKSSGYLGNTIFKISERKKR